MQVLTIQRISPADRARIAAVDPRIRLTDAGGWFDGEIRETWPAFTAARYLPPDSHGLGTRVERDALLAQAEVILGGWPFPMDLRARSPRLRWFHQRPAGASNLRMGDLWGSDVLVTTSRGAGNTLAMAEYALAGILHFAKSMDTAIAERDLGRFTHRAYRPLLLADKTVCIIGAGGIGQDLAPLCAGLGMRVVGTRRRPSGPLPAGFNDISGPDALDRYLPEADFVVVCCQWTDETTNLIDDRTLGLMKPGAILVNVARGEVVDEAAVARALAADRLRGVVMDVYVGEFEHGPPPVLWEDKRVIITPHVSGASDENRHGAIEIFCDNLRAWLDGRPLQNVIDWAVGY